MKYLCFKHILHKLICVPLISSTRFQLYNINSSIHETRKHNYLLCFLNGLRLVLGPLHLSFIFTTCTSDIKMTKTSTNPPSPVGSSASPTTNTPLEPAVNSLSTQRTSSSIEQIPDEDDVAPLPTSMLHFAAMELQTDDDETKKRGRKAGLETVQDDDNEAPCPMAVSEFHGLPPGKGKAAVTARGATIEHVHDDDDALVGACHDFILAALTN